MADHQHPCEMVRGHEAEIKYLREVINGNGRPGLKADVLLLRESIKEVRSEMEERRRNENENRRVLWATLAASALAAVGNVGLAIFLYLLKGG